MLLLYFGVRSLELPEVIEVVRSTHARARYERRFFPASRYAIFVP